jgi:hypothetical protein
VWILWTCALWYLVHIFNSSIFWDTRRWIKSKNTIRRMIGWFVCGELERMWQEAVVTYVKVLSQNLMQSTSLFSNNQTLGSHKTHLRRVVSLLLLLLLLLLHLFLLCLMRFFLCRKFSVHYSITVIHTNPLYSDSNLPLFYEFLLTSCFLWNINHDYF